MIHSSIKMTPCEATKPSSAIDVNYNLELQGRFTRTFLELELGSSVKIFNNKNMTTSKS